MTPDTSEIIIYQTDDDRTKISVRMEDETVWLTQAQMVELFQSSKANISEHIRRVFDDGELAEESVVRNFRTTAADGKNYPTKHYSLDVIISVGYRVKSLRGETPLCSLCLRAQNLNFVVRTKARRTQRNLDDFVQRYGKGILSGPGTVSHQAAITKAESEYAKYRKKIKDEPTPVERDYLESIKDVQKKLEKESKPKKKKCSTPS
jgi:hypothetical protein